MKRFQRLAEFISYINQMDLSGDLNDVANKMYNELETVDLDFDKKIIKESSVIPRDVKKKIFDLYDFYREHADDCVNIYLTDKRKEFLCALKEKAAEINNAINDLIIENL